MGRLLALFCILVAVEASVLKKPKPCTTPPQWEAKAVETIFGKHVRAYLKISYDATEQRMRIAEDISIGGKMGKREFFDVLLLFHEKAMYVMEIKINPKIKRTCTKHPLKEPFKGTSIPKDATFYAQQYIGTGAEPGAGLLTNVWGGQVQEKNASYVVVVTNNLCIPVWEQVTMPEVGEIQYGYYDVTLGVDPEVFRLPKECEKLEHEELSYETTKHLPGKKFFRI